MAGVHGFDAVIFDFDGVLLDTEMPAYTAWQEVYAEHGADLPLALWAQEIGTTDAFDALAHLESLAGVTLDRDGIVARRQARKLELTGALQLLPGVVDRLDEAKLHGLRCAIASSSPREWVHGLLDRHHLTERFEAVICREDVEVVKPAPDLYLRALAVLGVGPDRAVAIEDSPNGIAAAKAAGLACVAVPHDLTRDLPLDAADIQIRSLADVGLDELLASVQKEVAGRVKN